MMTATVPPMRQCLLSLILLGWAVASVRFTLDFMAMEQAMWFHAKDTGKFDIVCAELCGWGHYKMKGRLTVESRKDFEHWLRQKYESQETNQIPLELAER